MKYLSFDIEATGLEENDLIIEFAAIPVDTKEKKVYQEWSFHCYIQCPSFEELKPNLSLWVQENNKELIQKAHLQGRSLTIFKNELEAYLQSSNIQGFFNKEKIVLLGKSLNAIDLPFLNRDLGWDWMRKYFSHRTLDVTSATYLAIDSGSLPIECESGSELMKHFGMGDVAHTALEDAINTAKLYFKLMG